MKKSKIRGMALIMTVCLLGGALTSCGESETTGDSEVIGRVTAVSEQEITISVFPSSDRNGRPEGVSGGAFEGKERPEGTPPAGMQKGERPKGTPPADMQKGEPPEGTPPADRPDGEAGDGKTGGQMGESKTIAIDSDTKVYQENGEEKTEITLSELELGSQVTVQMDGEKAVSITVQQNRGGRGNFSREEQAQ